MNHALITMWDVINQRPAWLIEWDIIFLPLLFGPVSLTDNMLVANRGLTEAIQKEWVRELLKTYRDAGLIKLYHRERRRPGIEIRSIQDIIGIWADRTSKKDNWTVGFGCLSEPRNEELRKLVRRNKKKEDEKRVTAVVDFLDREVQGYAAGLKYLSEMFFDDHGPLSRVTWSDSPISSLQCRVLEAAGVERVPELLATAEQTGTCVFDLIPQGQFGSAHAVQYPGYDWANFNEAAREDGAVRAFFEVMSSSSDVGRRPLVRAASQIESEDPKAASLLGTLIHAAYASGIPEKEGEGILWPHIDPLDSTEVLPLSRPREREDMGWSIAQLLRENSEILLRGDWQESAPAWRRGRELLRDLRQVAFGTRLDPAAVQPVGAVLGAIIGALVMGQIPGVEAFVGDDQFIQWALIEGAGAGLGGLIGARLLPRLLGHKGAMGKYGGSFYRKGLRVLKHMDQVDGNLLSMAAPIFADGTWLADRATEGL